MLFMTDQQATLPDGRKLGFAEYGCFQGKPVFYFHGWPSSRLSGQDLGPTAKRHGARVIAIDRPGLSDFQPGRQIINWPQDVTFLADYLNIDHFAVIGTCAGAPYVAACALKIPQRLNGAVIVSGLGPFNVPGVLEHLPPHLRRLKFTSTKTPLLMRFFLNRWRDFALHNPDGFLTWSFARFSKTELLLHTRPATKRNFIRCFLEAHRHGSRGTTLEMALLSRPWGFHLEDIAMKVYLWHGKEDRAAPPSMGRYLADTIPQCEARFIPGEGHTTLFLNNEDDIFGILTSC
jgi:pimeloyl-ACP methyl ester carboxylesterase